MKSVLKVITSILVAPFGLLLGLLAGVIILPIYVATITIESVWE